MLAAEIALEVGRQVVRLARPGLAPVADEHPQRRVLRGPRSARSLAPPAARAGRRGPLTAAPSGSHTAHLRTGGLPVPRAGASSLPLRRRRGSLDGRATTPAARRRRTAPATTRRRRHGNPLAGVVPAPPTVARLAIAARGAASARSRCSIAVATGAARRPPRRPAHPVAGPYVDGISDQNVPYWNGDVWSGGPPASPFGRFVAATLVAAAGDAPPLRYARYVVAYDVMCDPAGPAFADLRALARRHRALGLRPDVAFWYGDFDGNRCPALPLIPRSPAQYNERRPVAAFLRAFPAVRTIEPWNEPNDGHRPDVPAATAAAFWLAAPADCASARATPSSPATSTTPAATSSGYERRYVAALGGAAALDWGIHPYAPVNHERERRCSSSRPACPTPRADRVWYTEIGAFYCTRKRNAERGYDRRASCRRSRSAARTISSAR